MAGGFPELRSEGAEELLKKDVASRIADVTSKTQVQTEPKALKPETLHRLKPKPQTTTPKKSTPEVSRGRRT